MVWEVLCGLFSCYCWRLLCLLPIAVHNREARRQGSDMPSSIFILTASISVLSFDLANQTILRILFLHLNLIPSKIVA